MISATVLAIFLVPAFFVVVLRLVESHQNRAGNTADVPSAPIAGERP
jgi:hypothetical protein